MMPMIRRLHQMVVESENLRAMTYPTSNDGVAVVPLTLVSAAVAWTYGLWITLIAAGVLATDVQIEAVLLDNFVGAPSDGEIEIGLGLAGSEVLMARFPAAMASWFIMNPIMVRAGTRVAGRYRTSTGAADSVDTYIYTLSGF